VNNINSDTLVFVVYSPGAFGSFLSLVLEQSEHVDHLWDETVINNFDSDGAAHIKLSNWIKNFHDGNDIDRWVELPDNDKIEYIESRLFKVPTNNLKIHSFTVPSAIPELIKIFSKSKIIYIQYDEQNKELVVNNFINKIIKTDRFAKNKLSSIINKVLSKASDIEKFKYYRKIAIDRLDKINLKTIPIGVKIVPIASFLSWEDFLVEYQQICSYLKIKPELHKVKELYNEFIKVNGLNG